MTGTFEGVGSLQFTPDNKFCYAYSGGITIADTDTHTALSFRTDSEYIVANFIFWRRSWEANDVAFYVEFNGEQVLSWIGGANPPSGSNKKPLIIPPFTEVVVYIDKQEHSSTSIVGANLTGKVFGAIEQENLESITDNNKWASK